MDGEASKWAPIRMGDEAPGSMPAIMGGLGSVGEAARLVPIVDGLGPGGEAPSLEPIMDGPGWLDDEAPGLVHMGGESQGMLSQSCSLYSLKSH